MKQPIEKCGKMRIGKNYRSVYMAVAPIQCGCCSRRIEIGELVTRGSTKEFSYSCFLCADCRTIVINTTQGKPHPLSCYIESREWFDKANGNIPELLTRIAQACGYEHFKATRGFANMVGWHIDKYYSKLLAARFFCLLNEASEEFPVIRSEASATFEMHGE